jgi:hypothetical protein
MTRFWHYAIYISIFVGLATLVSRVIWYAFKIDLLPENYVLGGLVFYFVGMAMTYSLANAIKLSFRGWNKIVWFSTLFLLLVAGAMAGFVIVMINATLRGTNSFATTGIWLAYFAFVLGTVLYAALNTIVGYFVAKKVSQEF